MTARMDSAYRLGVLAVFLAASAGPALAQSGSNGGLGNSAPALSAPMGNPALQRPSAAEPVPRTMAPPPAPVPAQPSPMATGSAGGSTNLPGCMPPNCGTPSIMAPP